MRLHASASEWTSRVSGAEEVAGKEIRRQAQRKRVDVMGGGGGALRSLLRGFGVEVKDIDVTRRVAGTKGGRHAKRHSIFAVSAGGKYQAIQNARNSPPHIYINAAILAAGHQNQNRIEMNAAEPPPPLEAECRCYGHFLEREYGFFITSQDV
jgi:hypothetical protein